MNDTLPMFPEQWKIAQIRRMLRGVDGIRIGPFGSALTLDQMVAEGFKVYGQENVIAEDFTVGTRYLSPTKYTELKACSIASSDLLVTMMGTTGRCCVVPEEIADGIMDSHLIRLRFQRHEVDPFFMALLIDKGHYVREQICAAGKGTIMSGLNSSIMKEVWVGLPDLTVQRRIIKYIGEHTSKIDRLIALRRRQMELLKGQRTALIQQAVTRGLNSAAQMKDSGIPWLGEIPVHWVVKPIKHIFFSLDGKRVPLSGADRQLMTNREYDYYGASGIIDKVDDYIFDETLILLGEDGANLLNRRTPLAFIATGKYWVNNHAHILKPRRGSMEYLVCLLEAVDYAPYVEGSAQPKLTLENLMAVKIPEPPENEQFEILRFIEYEGAKIDSLISAYVRQLTLLTEYRAALIHECVTGQRQMQ